MTGEEVRDILKKNGIGLVELADKLGITNQALNSRFYAKSFRPEYLQQINEILGKDLFGLSDTSDKGQKILDIRVCAGQGMTRTKCWNSSIFHLLREVMVWLYMENPCMTNINQEM